MPQHHFNELATNSTPTEAAIGTLSDETEIESVVQALAEVGVPADRLYFMQGEEGAALVEKSGNFFSRLLHQEAKARPLAALRDGKTMVAVFGVDQDDAESIRNTLTEAGVVHTHYFGRWTYS